MTSDRTKNNAPAAAKPPRENARDLRLKQALRENLQRRKGQAKLRKSNENKQEV